MDYLHTKALKKRLQYFGSFLVLLSLAGWFLATKLDMKTQDTFNMLSSLFFLMGLFCFICQKAVKV